MGLIRFRSALLSALVLSAAALFGPVAAFAQAKIVHLHDPAHDVKWLEWLQLSKEKFEAANPDVEVEILVPASRTDQLDKIVAMYATGILPDVIETFPTVGYEFALDGIYRDISPYMEKETALGWTDFFPIAVESSKVLSGERAGTVWMLPVSIFTLGFAFNLNHFSEAGLVAPTDRDNPWTWDDFIEMGVRLTKVGPGGEVERYATWIQGTWDRWLGWVHNAGEYPFDEYILPASSRFRTESVRAALQLWQDMYFNLRFAMYGGSGARLHQGLTSFVVATPSFTNQYESVYQGTVDYDFGPFPKRERAGSEVLTLGVAMGAQSSNPEAAWRWMKFLATEAAEDHIAVTGRPSPWAPVGRYFVELYPGATEKERVWTELISHPEAFPRPVVENSVSDVITNYLNQVRTGAIDVGNAMEAMDREIAALLAARAEGG